MIHNMNSSVVVVIGHNIATTDAIESSNKNLQRGEANLREESKRKN